MQNYRYHSLILVVMFLLLSLLSSLGVTRSRLKNVQTREPFAGEFPLKAVKARTTRGAGMTNFIFIETRDPFNSPDTQFVEQTATALKQLGHEVTVFLVQNGVLASRRNARDSYLPRLTKAGISLLADGFSLCERHLNSRTPSRRTTDKHRDAGRCSASEQHQGHLALKLITSLAVV